MLRAVAAVLASVTIGAALAACGGDDDKDSLTKAQYIARADATCDQARKNRPPPPPPTASPAVQTRYQTASIQRSVALSRRLQTLDAPEELRDPMKRYFASLAQSAALQREAIRLTPQALKTGDFGLANGANSSAELLSVKRTKLLGPLGFKKCGNADRYSGYLPASFQKRADAICTRANQSIAKAAGGVDKYGSPKYPPALPALARVYAASLPDGQQAARELKALPKPTVNPAKWDEFVRAYVARIGYTAQQLAASRAGSQAGLDAAGEKDAAAYGKERDAAQVLGLEVCGISSPANT